METKQAFTCKNPSCQKTFTTALKTLNLQQYPTEPYYACPFCLTEIESIKSTEEIQPQEPQLTVNQTETKERSHSDKQTSCRYHLGYLNERSSKEQFPDDCLVCKDVLECMTRKVAK